MASTPSPIDDGFADEIPPSPAQVEGDAKPSLSMRDIAGLARLVGEIRASLGQLPSSIAAEVTNLLATVEGHVAAAPPNPVATGEALALIRDQLEKCPESAVAKRLAQKSIPVLKTLGETVA